MDKYSTPELLASTLSKPAEWLIQALGGTKSNAGIKVGYKDALTIAYAFAAQQIISGDVASLPLETKRREADDDLVLDRKHPVYWVLNGDSNDEMSAYLFRETMTHWALVFGNAMAYIARDSSRNVSALIPACPGELTIERKDGVRLYHNHRLGRTFGQDDILHVRGLGDELGGHSLLTLARNSFGLSLAQDKHGSQAWKNGAGPRVILKHPSKNMSKEEADELIDTFEARHREAGRAALAAGGLEIEVVPASNSDAQWIESRRQIIVEVAAWYNLPPHKLGDTSRVGYNGVAAENQSYITQCLRRWLRRWETEVSRKLLTPREYRTFATIVKHDPAPLTETDSAAVTADVVNQRTAELITVNEGRKRLGYPRIEDGDVRQNPNTSSGTDAPPPESEETVTATVDRAPFVAMLTDTLGIVATALGEQAGRRITKGQPLGDEWRATWTARVNDKLGPEVDAASAVFATMPMATVTAHIGEWCTAAAHGGVLVPSPAELAKEIVGEPHASR